MDNLSSYYADLLEGSYDCVDRIVVNAYFPLGQSSGGLRSWWRAWQGGEKTLSDASMKAIAGDFARRLKGWCQQRGIPFIECHGEKEKHVLAEALLPQDPKFRGSRGAQRWLYSACLCFALPVEEQRRSGFRDKFSVWQIEYSRNLLFRDGLVREEVYQKLIDRTRVSLDIKALKTLFGVRHRQPGRKQRAGRSEPEVSKEVERVGPYDVTVFKVRWGNLVLKIYDQGQRVLRVEVRALNTAALKVGKRLEKLPEILGGMQQMLVRLLAVVQAAHIGFLDAGQWERGAEPTQRGNRRLAGLDMNKARNRAVVETVVALASAPEGFAVEQVAQAMRERLGCAPEAYSTRRAAYDLAKVRGKELVERIPGRRRYQSQPTQLRALCGYVLLREQVIKPLLAGAAKTSVPPPPRQLSPIDQQYLVLREHMTQAFELLGLAA